MVLICTFVVPVSTDPTSLLPAIVRWTKGTTIPKIYTVFIPTYLQKKSKKGVKGVYLYI